MQGSPTKKNLVGKTFTNLVVLRPIGKRGARWMCKCICGKERIFYTSDLLNRHNYSCGCRAGKGNEKHGLWKTRFYRIYDGLRRRCVDKKNENYSRYGGRGIKCLWKTALDFKNDMYESYLKHCDKFGIDETQIERANNDGNYCKENCRWATRYEQNRNKSDNVFVNYKGKKMIVTDYAKLIGANRMTLYSRIKRGLSV